ncbi:hypothetical protein H4Q26_005406 [Puccinia striiformis f. sp. tritici PST-130]|nr:hypothetical protein H4Q26_005406 [Puccinia striiformis f. sp. tritici PST-130]
MKDDVELSPRVAGWPTDAEPAMPGPSPRCTPEQHMSRSNRATVPGWTSIFGAPGLRRAEVAQTAQPAMFPRLGDQIFRCLLPSPRLGPTHHQPTPRSRWRDMELVTPGHRCRRFNPGNGGTYHYHHGRQSLLGEQLHNPSPNYYQPNQPGTGHTIGTQVDGNPAGSATPSGGGHTYTIDRQSTSSGGYSSRASQHSRDLDTPTASLRLETATWICDNFKALRNCVGQPEEMVKMAQPLFNIPKNERWPASVIMQLCWLISFAGTPQVSHEKAVTPKVQNSSSLTTFITTTLRRVILSPELDSFGRQSSVKKTDALNAQSPQWLETHLSVKWREDGELVERVEQTIAKRFKSDKNPLATIIKSGLANPSRVPQLRKLVCEVHGQMNSRFKDVDPKKIYADKEITSAARARLAYLRLLIHLNQLEHERIKGTKNLPPPHFWTAIEEDLARRAGKPAIYKYAFGLLILAKDRALWGNDATLAKDITAEQAALPTEEEIEAKIAKINGHANEDEGSNEESDDGNGLVG